jgi:hypothetical protein
LGLVLELIDGEFFCAVREVAAKDHDVGPVIANQVGDHVGLEGALPVAPSQRGKDQVVIAGLFGYLLADQNEPALQGLRLAGHRRHANSTAALRNPLRQDRSHG